MESGQQQRFLGDLEREGIEELWEGLDGTNTIRGSLRRVFWASETDLEDFLRENTGPGGEANWDSFRLARLLGMHDMPGPYLVIRLIAGGVDRFVPTGFDAFDHPHFSPQDPGESVPQYNRTKDLDGSTQGAREIVTGELLGQKDNFEFLYFVFPKGEGDGAEVS